ncbi:formate dehydrogenase subunit alpha [candidate division NPL-UPA2 bacterium Unc8]|uniref:Formate dehydrogenase subunit alpha n=1 Tax=candidate division NPL-UPA2 bacterium Unc8 TaxID=1980939 RepID=A0A399FWS9_UNCN2|nr:MAG: formate dehydrogenase subunit alpha [candidate division NPL-UPA2 bacterium Unc8]
MTNTVDEIAGAGAILVTGINPTESQPVIGYRIRQAVRNGAKLIVADPRRIQLAEIADVHLQFKPGTDIALFNALAHVIIKEGLQDQEYIETRTQDFQHLKKMVEKYTPDYVAKITGVAAEKIITAARLFAQADSGSIFYAMGVTQHTCGTENVVALTNLSLLTGNLGKPHAGMYPLRGQNNVQGACDMGCLPNVLTGYQPVHSDRDTGTYWQRLKGAVSRQPSAVSREEAGADSSVIESIEFDEPISLNMSVSDTIRAKFSRAWGVELSDVPGRTIAEMFHYFPHRRSRIMYIMGENPVLTSPQAELVREALEDMDFVVVQDIFLNETAQYADVVLPAASFAEKDGTFINTERRVQLIRRAIKPRGDSKADWEIIQELANRFGLNWNYSSAEEIWDEVRELTPHYFGGMSYERLDAGGLQWPCTAIDHPGTPILHKSKFARGIGQFSTVEYRPLAADATDEDYPFILTTGRKLYHYHTRTMTGKSDGLNSLIKEERMEINPQDAEGLGLDAEDTVKVTSRRGSIKSKINLTDRVPPGLVCMSFHFAESPVNVLMNPAVCNMSVASGLKSCGVRIEKA